MVIMFFVSLVKTLGRKLILPLHVVRKSPLKWSIYLFLLIVCSRMQVLRTRESVMLAVWNILHIYQKSNWKFFSYNPAYHTGNNLPTLDSKHNKSFSKTLNSIMIHAKYKPTISKSSNSIQTADPTFQIINFIK